MKKGDQVKIQTSGQIGIITAVEPRLGFRGRYPYFDYYIKVDGESDIIVKRNWEVTDLTQPLETEHVNLTKESDLPGTGVGIEEPVAKPRRGRPPKIRPDSNPA